MWRITTTELGSIATFVSGPTLLAKRSSIASFGLAGSDQDRDIDAELLAGNADEPVQAVGAKPIEIGVRQAEQHYATLANFDHLQPLSSVWPE